MSPSQRDRIFSALVCPEVEDALADHGVTAFRVLRPAYRNDRRRGFLEEQGLEATYSVLGGGPALSGPDPVTELSM